MEAVAEASLAARLEASRLGMAMAAIMPMIATTMRSSISEKPSWRLVVIFLFVLLREKVFKVSRANGLVPHDVKPRRARSVGCLNYKGCARRWNLSKGSISEEFEFRGRLAGVCGGATDKFRHDADDGFCQRGAGLPTHSAF